MIKNYLVLFFCMILTSNLFAQMDEEELESDSTEMDFKQIGKSDISINKYKLGEGIVFTSSKGGLLNINGYLQTAAEFRHYEGDDKFYNRFRVRRARLRLNGQVFGDKVRYRLGVDLVKGSDGDSESGSMLNDAWVSYRPYGSKLVITMGQRATPTDNRELHSSSYALQLPDRSKLSSIFGTVREVGIFVESSLKVGSKSYIRPSLAITDGDGPITSGKRYGGMKYGARVNYLPFGLFRMSGESRQGDMVYELSPKLSIGVAYSYNNGTSDRRGGNGGTPILYANDLGEVTLPDYGKVVVDFLFKYRGLSVLGEWVKSHVTVPGSISQRIRNDGTFSSDFNVDGNQSVGDYIRNRMMVGSGFNIQAGYFFRNYWSVDARYTHLVPDNYSYMNNDLYFNRNDFYELGVTKYLTKSYTSKIQLSHTFIKPNGASRKLNGETFEGNESLTTLSFQIRF